MLPSVWPPPLSLATTQGISVDVFSSPYLDVSVQAVPPVYLWIQYTVTEFCSAGFPHSDIHGSLPAFGFPWLFVDRYVLLRLPVPRHPPCALVSLTCPPVVSTEVFQSCSNHFLWVLLAIRTPCSSICVSKILRLVCAQYTNSSCLASHSSLFLYSVFKVHLAVGSSRSASYLSYSASAACFLPPFWPRLPLPFPPRVQCSHSLRSHLARHRPWWAQMDSNHRPHAYQACALTT